MTHFPLRQDGISATKTSQNKLEENVTLTLIQIVQRGLRTLPPS